MAPPCHAPLSGRSARPESARAPARRRRARRPTAGSASATADCWNRPTRSEISASRPGTRPPSRRPSRRRPGTRPRPRKRRQPSRRLQQRITSPDAAAAKAAALAPELWRALDANDHGDAASCYLAVAALTTQAQGALGPVARMLRTRSARSDGCVFETHGRGVTFIVCMRPPSQRVYCATPARSGPGVELYNFSSSRDGRGCPQ